MTRQKSPSAPLPPEERVGFLIYRAGLAVSRGYERALAPIGVTPPEAGVLSLLAYVGPNHVRGLSRALGIGRQTAVNVTKRLEQAQLVTRTESQDDARMIILSISGKGRQKLEAIEVIASDFDRMIRELIQPDSEHRLGQILTRIVHASQFEYDA